MSSEVIDDQGVHELRSTAKGFMSSEVIDGQGVHELRGDRRPINAIFNNFFIHKC